MFAILNSIYHSPEVTQKVTGSQKADTRHRYFWHSLLTSCDFWKWLSFVIKVRVDILFRISKHADLIRRMVFQSNFCTFPLRFKTKLIIYDEKECVICWVDFNFLIPQSKGNKFIVSAGRKVSHMRNKNFMSLLKTGQI